MDVPASAAIALAGLALSLLTSFGLYKFNQGKQAAEIENLKRLVVTQDEVVHKRITKAQEETARNMEKIENGIEKLDNRMIEVIREVSTLKGEQRRKDV